MSGLPVLAFDTTTDWLVLAVVGADGAWLRLVEARRAHQELLVSETDALLAAAGRALGDIACVAVGVGPGSFTGLRVGVAFARTLGHALDLPVAAVDSLMIVALSGAMRASSGKEAVRVLAAVDARRAARYVGVYEVRAVPRVGEGASVGRTDGPYEVAGRPFAELLAVEAVAASGPALVADSDVAGYLAEHAGYDVACADESTARLLRPGGTVVAAQPLPEALAALGAKAAASAGPWREALPAYLRPSSAEEGLRPARGG